MTLLLGWLVALVDVAQFLPQARRTLAQRLEPEALLGLSVPTWCVATGQAVAWIVYGTAEGLWAIVLPNLVIAPVCALVLILRLRAGRQVRREVARAA